MTRLSFEDPLFCQVGDVVKFKKTLTTSPWKDEMPANIHAGDLYVVTSLVGSGWDLERKTGNGPQNLRILNSELPDYATVTSN